MNKSLQYLLAIFGVLLLLFFINQGQQKKYNISTEAIFNVDENNIYKILLQDSKDTVNQTYLLSSSVQVKSKFLNFA